MEQLILHMIHTEQLIILNLVILGFRTIHSTQSERPPRFKISRFIQYINVMKGLQPKIHDIQL